MKEADLELFYATKLAHNVGTGLQLLKPASISAGIRAYGDSPVSFLGLREWVKAFISFMIERKPKDRDKWADLRAESDVELYVSRKIWTHKVTNGTAQSSSAVAVAAVTHVAQYARAQAHEAINHSIKHNENIEHLLTEMHDHIDQVLLTNFTNEITKVAGALVSLHPEIAGMIAATPLELTHDAA